jgi:hypothetical protein
MKGEFVENSIYYHKAGKTFSDNCAGDSGIEVGKFEEHLSSIKTSNS